MSFEIPPSPARFERPSSTGNRAGLAGMYGVVAALHAVGWGLLLVLARHLPALSGLGALAYGFGLRHAFDADHISAIDTSTRKLVHEGRHSLGSGLYFSLGHSAVVLAITLALGLAARGLVGATGVASRLREIGPLVGAAISGLFLLAIGLVNLQIFIEGVAALRRSRGAPPATEPGNAGGLGPSFAGGALSRLFRGLFRVVSASWHLFPVGLLFGLGFDTASEVALLALSVGAASSGVPLAALFALPLVFAAGMSLVDASDGLFMTRTYAWAPGRPLDRRRFNLVVTGLSVVAALGVGGIELLQAAVASTGWSDALTRAIASIDLARAGYVICAAFLVVWLLAALLLRRRRAEAELPIAPEE